MLSQADSCSPPTQRSRAAVPACKYTQTRPSWSIKDAGNGESLTQFAPSVGLPTAAGALAARGAAPRRTPPKRRAPGAVPPVCPGLSAARMAASACGARGRAAGGGEARGAEAARARAQNRRRSRRGRGPVQGSTATALNSLAAAECWIYTIKLCVLYTLIPTVHYNAYNM